VKEKLKKIFLTRYNIPKAELLEEAVRKFSLTEKIIFYGLGILLTIGALTALLNINDAFLVTVPSHGGSLTEGIIGVPRFINPLLALSDADRDMSSLVYSGLLKATPEGTLLPDLAESYSLSADGLIYTFVLKKNITFHDGTPVTADDVVFTIEKAQDPAMKSPKRPNWEGVQVKKINEILSLQNQVVFAF
jgi:peptide/nickel transport system substrate-binding protein